MTEPSGPPPVPKFSCGGAGQPACPPEPAIVEGKVELWTRAQVEKHGQACYEKGIADASGE